MTVREYNNWYKSYDNAYSFVNNIDHAIEKAGCSANHQMQCIGWSEDVKQTLIDALETLRDQKLQMAVKWDGQQRENYSGH